MNTNFKSTALITGAHSENPGIIGDPHRMDKVATEGETVELKAGSIYPTRMEEVMAQGMRKKLMVDGDMSQL